MSSASKEIMYMNWRELIKPKGIEIGVSSPDYGKFVCEPLERGFGITLNGAGSLSSAMEAGQTKTASDERSTGMRDGLKRIKMNLLR